MGDVPSTENGAQAAGVKEFNRDEFQALPDKEKAQRIVGWWDDRENPASTCNISSAFDTISSAVDPPSPEFGRVIGELTGRLETVYEKDITSESDPIKTLSMIISYYTVTVFPECGKTLASNRGALTFFVSQLRMYEKQPFVNIRNLMKTVFTITMDYIRQEDWKLLESLDFPRKFFGLLLQSEISAGLALEFLMSFLRSPASVHAITRLLEFDLMDKLATAKRKWGKDADIAELLGDVMLGLIITHPLLMRKELKAVDRRVDSVCYRLLETEKLLFHLTKLHKLAIVSGVHLKAALDSAEVLDFDNHTFDRKLFMQTYTEFLSSKFCIAYCYWGKCKKMDELGNFRVCGECRTAMYCSEKCQKKDWKKVHKQNCQNMKQKFKLKMKLQKAKEAQTVQAVIGQ